MKPRLLDMAAGIAMLAGSSIPAFAETPLSPDIINAVRHGISTVNVGDKTIKGSVVYVRKPGDNDDIVEVDNRLGRRRVVMVYEGKRITATATKEVKCEGNTERCEEQNNPVMYFIVRDNETREFNYEVSSGIYKSLSSGEVDLHDGDSPEEAQALFNKAVMTFFVGLQRR